MENYNDYNNTELIQRYFNGDLSKNERERFIQNLNTDTALAEEFEFTKTLKYALLKEGEADTRASIEKWQKAKQSNSTKKSYTNIWYWIVGSGVVIVSAFWIWKTMVTTKPKIDLSKIAAHPINFPVEDTELMTAYTDNDFEKALAGFQEMQSTLLDFYPAHLFTGICQLHIGQNTAALETMKYLQKQSPAELSEEIALYLGIAYYQNGQTDLAQEAWSAISPDTEKLIVADILKAVQEQAE